ncbi:hypothetical protein B0H11DRAFT_2240042 [Mycena galericulata]|nr:hypothetical protein B0H11DRAFT_2240042 [Mycena galericulata]
MVCAAANAASGHGPIAHTGCGWRRYGGAEHGDPQGEGDPMGTSAVPQMPGPIVSVAGGGGGWLAPQSLARLQRHAGRDLYFPSVSTSLSTPGAEACIPEHGGALRVQARSNDVLVDTVSARSLAAGLCVTDEFLDEHRKQCIAVERPVQQVRDPGVLKGDGVEAQAEFQSAEDKQNLEQNGNSERSKL